MSSKLLDRLLFAQGQSCFFCSRPLSRNAASVEHLLAKCHAGTNAIDNCVACCQELNSLFGSMTLKEKMAVVLHQRGDFRCPQTLQELSNPVEPLAPARLISQELLAAAIADLSKYVAQRPRTLQALQNHLTTSLRRQLDGASAQALVDHLRAIGIVVPGEDGTLCYRSIDKCG
jgi:hypothetical protein